MGVFYFSIIVDRSMRGNGHFRKYLILCVLSTPVMFFLYYTQFNTHEIQEELTSNYSQPTYNSLGRVEQYLIHTSKCRIPNDDPFNEDVKKYFRKEQYIPCSKKKLLTYIEKQDSFVTLHVNQSLLSTYSIFKISCCYSTVSRIVDAEKSDDEVKFSECIPFERSVNITTSIIKVVCKSPIHVEVYSNVHAVVSPLQITNRLISENNAVSVLFVGIDSISKMNLFRTMPKTVRWLNAHDFFNLKGYTKIADNTFPNLMAILTGKTGVQIYDQCHPDKNKLNDCDIIWDKFRDLGYVTAYAEDESAIGTFNYNRQGFGDPPTDFYFRPYTTAAERLPSVKKLGMHICAGPESSGQRIMNLAKDFATNFQKHPKFGLFWMNTFSHDNLNLPSSMDDKVKEFLDDIYPYLENTIFIFFSDHGFRFGNIRYTHTGWLEERLPFIYVHLPRTLKERQPQKYTNFMTNTLRLSSPYDIYMTLQDVLVSTNNSYSVQPSLACPKCGSLFEEIDEARTCKDAGIDQHWCMCRGHSYINPSRQIVKDTAQFIIDEVNDLVKSLKEGYKCAYYYLKEIVFSGMSENYLNEKNQSVNYFLIMVQTRPPAMFEATVEVEVRSHKLPNFRLLGDISRINRYGDNSKCIQDSSEKYCYCDGLFTSIKSAICNFLNCL